MSGEARASDSLRDGQAHEAAGRVSDAAECYAAAADHAAQDDQPRALSEALRRRGVLYHKQAKDDRARSLCSRAYDIAVVAGLDDLAAEALNALAGFELERGRLAEARQQYQAALEFASRQPELVGKIEQNLGVVANVRGDWAAAWQHYQRALAAYEQTKDYRGSAIAYHNLGRIHAERHEWEEAGQRFHLARKLAHAAGDVHLHGLALLSHAEVHLALRQYDDARRSVIEALGIFVRIQAERDRAGGHRLLGATLREMGCVEAAEPELATAIAIAQRAECPLEEADATREMARLYWRMGQTDRALTVLRRARELFVQVDATNDVTEVDALALAIETPPADATGLSGHAAA